MAKRGMKRIDPRSPSGSNRMEKNHKMNLPINDVPPVPEIQGKAKHSNKKV